MPAPKISFDGFPIGLLHFLEELSTNNNRNWFLENKSRYETDLVIPALNFIAALQAPLASISKHFRAVPKRTGGSLMRIYRDTRFAKDKTPYKTNVGIQLRHEQGKDVHAPGFYFHIDVDNVFIGCGIWHPAGPALTSIRKLIDEYPARWKRLKNAEAFKKTFQLAGDSLKRPPRGHAADHPLIEDLKRKDHIAVTNLKIDDLLDKKIVAKTIQHFKASKNYVKFLCDALRLPF